MDDLRIDLTDSPVLKRLIICDQTELDRRSLGTLMYRLDQKGYVNVDVSTRVNLYTAKVKEEEARKKKGREILKLWYDGSLDQLVSDLYSAQDEDEDEEDN